MAKKKKNSNYKAEDRVKAQQAKANQHQNMSYSLGGSTMNTGFYQGARKEYSENNEILPEDIDFDFASYQYKLSAESLYDFVPKEQVEMFLKQEIEGKDYHLLMAYAPLAGNIQGIPTLLVFKREGNSFFNGGINYYNENMKKVENLQCLQVIFVNGIVLDPIHSTRAYPISEYLFLLDKANEGYPLRLDSTASSCYVQITEDRLGQITPTIEDLKHYKIISTEF